MTVIIKRPGQPVHLHGQAAGAALAMLYHRGRGAKSPMV